ncbi:hypothetical protein TUM19329_12380 [Legionella antarctica]|uniref:Uncharacterized protein n=1 Tax=Legionella antarctica TaxID=2708020 RepID=A0A6F8T3Y5_9GAMM|nr:hypothetical protein TUM19329_12380 [Legionella antarctica]
MGSTIQLAKLTQKQVEYIQCKYFSDEELKLQIESLQSSLVTEEREYEGRPEF